MPVVANDGTATTRESCPLGPVKRERRERKRDEHHTGSELPAPTHDRTESGAPGGARAPFRRRVSKDGWFPAKYTCGISATMNGSRSWNG